VNENDSVFKSLIFCPDSLSAILPTLVHISVSLLPADTIAPATLKKFNKFYNPQTKPVEVAFEDF